MNTSLGFYHIMSLAPYRDRPCQSVTCIRIRIPFLGRTLTALAILFLIPFSIFLFFLPAPFVVAVFAIGRAANGQNSWRQSGSTARLKAEAQPKLSRVLGAPFELARSSSGSGALQLIFSRDGLRFVVRESFKAIFVLTFYFLFSFSFFICEFLCVQFAACRVVAGCICCRFCASFAVIIKVQHE